MPLLSRRRGREAAPRRRVLRLSIAPLALACLALAGGPLLASVTAPDAVGPAARAMGPLPACRYDDILTSPRAYRLWAHTLVDTILMVPRTYVPPDLVPVSEAGIEGSGKVRLVMIDDLRAMADAAREADAGIGVQSAYRSYEQQVKTFQGWVDRYGREEALKFSARPGHSEHQLGLAIDFRSESGGSPFEGDWGDTKAGQWMAANAWKYGFVMSYPRGKRSVTCYTYESWHFRYLGRDLAKAIHQSGLTIREYLWASFTTAVVPPPSGEPLPTYAPTERPSPSASPSESPTVSPGPSPTTAPSPPPSPSAPPPPTLEPSAEPSPSAPPPPGGGLAGGVAPGVAAATIAGLATLAAVLLLLLLRRGRFGAVL